MSLVLNTSSYGILFPPSTFDLRGTRKVEIGHTNLHFLAKKLPRKVEVFDLTIVKKLVHSISSLMIDKINFKMIPQRFWESRHLNEENIMQNTCSRNPRKGDLSALDYKCEMLKTALNNNRSNDQLF